jgi:hypothetical protein
MESIMDREELLSRISIDPESLLGQALYPRDEDMGLGNNWQSRRRKL